MVRSFAHRIPWIFIAFIIRRRIFLFFISFSFFASFSHPGLSMSVSHFGFTISSVSLTSWVFYLWCTVEKCSFWFSNSRFFFSEMSVSLKFKWGKCYCGNMSTDINWRFSTSYLCYQHYFRFAGYVLVSLWVLFLFHLHSVCCCRTIIGNGVKTMQVKWKKCKMKSTLFMRLVFKIKTLSTKVYPLFSLMLL